MAVRSRQRVGFIQDLNTVVVVLVVDIQDLIMLHNATNFTGIVGNDTPKMTRKVKRNL
jgi:hypothetical protein